MDVVIRFALIALSAVLLSSCGGGSSGSSVAVQGLWRGTVDGRRLTAMIRQGGPTVFYDPFGQTYVFADSPGERSFTGSGRLYAPRGEELDENPDLSTSVALSGNASSASISGTFDWTLDGANGQPQISASEHFDVQPYAALGDASAIHAGQWSGYYVDGYASSGPPVALSIDMAGDGGFTGTDMYSCDLSGSIQPVPGTADLFAVDIESTGPNSFCRDHVSGLAYASDTDDTGYFARAAGLYYYLAGSGYVIEFKAK